jgi:hypothetical protein
MMLEKCTRRYLSAHFFQGLNKLSNHTRGSQVFVVKLSLHPYVKPKDLTLPKQSLSMPKVKVVPLLPAAPAFPLLPAGDDSIKKSGFQPIQGSVSSALEEMVKTFERFRRKQRLQELLEQNRKRLAEIELLQIKITLYLADQYIKNQRNPFVKNYVSTIGFIKQATRLLLNFFT